MKPAEFNCPRVVLQKSCENSQKLTSQFAFFFLLLILFIYLFFVLFSECSVFRVHVKYIEMQSMEIRIRKIVVHYQLAFYKVRFCEKILIKHEPGIASAVSAAVYVDCETWFRNFLKRLPDLGQRSTLSWCKTGESKKVEVRMKKLRRTGKVVYCSKLRSEWRSLRGSNLSGN